MGSSGEEEKRRAGSISALLPVTIRHLPCVHARKHKGKKNQNQPKPEFHSYMLVLELIKKCIGHQLSLQDSHFGSSVGFLRSRIYSLCPAGHLQADKSE